ncbi:vitellogenin-1-like [Sarcophilus harrisii]
MRNLVLFLLFVLPGLSRNQQVNYELNFQEGKKYIYEYNSILLSGLPEKGLGLAGLNLKSEVEISCSTVTFPVMKIYSVTAADYNGRWPSDSFIESPELTQILESQLSYPIQFLYKNGHIGDIYAPQSMSEDALNLYKGIMNIFEVTIKKPQTTYNLLEIGMSGLCNTTYFIKEDKKYNLIHITKSTDLNDCKESINKNTGFAYAVYCKECKPPKRNSRSTSTTSYKIKISKGQPLIISAEIMEQHQFTPFNELTGGGAVTEIWKKLELINVQKASSENQVITFQNRGNLFYRFGSELIQMPVHLFKIHNIERQIVDIMENLVGHMKKLGPGEVPSKFLQLVQLFRVADVTIMESVWKKCAGKSIHRRLFLDVIPAVANIKSVKFLRLKLEQQELSLWETLQTVLVSLHFCTATQEVMEEAKLILENTRSNPQYLLHITGFLAYGSLVYRHCANLAMNCSESSLQPLHDLLTEAAYKGDEEEIILALKSIGNAGHPASLKQIKKFLPGFSSGASDLPIQILIAAALSLRNIGKRNPKEVQEIAIYAFLTPNVPPQVKIVLSLVIFETIPGIPVLATMANVMLKERSLQVASFVYSQMKALGRSSAPEHRSLALACRLALKMLKPTAYQTDFNVKLSRSYCWDSFSELLMAGFALKYYSLNKAGSTIPPEIIFALKSSFLGNTADILEFEMHTEEMLATILKKNLSRSDSYRVDIKDFIKMLPDWKAIPSDKSLISLYVKLFGQEIFWLEFDKQAIWTAIQTLQQSEGRFQLIKKILDGLQNGYYCWVKPLLFSEIRTILPTSFGLPIERSFYFISVWSLSGDVQSQISPAPSENFRLMDLFNMNIETHLQANLGIEKYIIAVMGVNTNLLQAIIEVYAKIQADLPLDVTSSLNFKAQSFKFEFPTFIHNTKTAYVRYQTYAVTRNIKAPSDAKMTPVVRFYFHDSYQDLFNSTSGSEGQGIRRVTPALDISEENSDRDVASDFKTVCYNMSTLGFRLCFLYTSFSAAYIKPVPLYYVVGEYFIIVTIQPEPAIQKVQVAIQTGPEARAKVVQLVHFEAGNSSSEERDIFKEMEETDKPTFLGDTVPPIMTVIVRAIRTDNKKQGFQVTGYVNSDRNNLQLVVVPLTSEKWKVCADAIVLPQKTKGSLRWGMDCKNYKIEVQATVDQLNKKPAIYIKIDWKNLPQLLQTIFEKILKYLSEITGESGFSETQGEKPSHQAIFQAMATSSRTIHAVIKIPEVNTYYSTLPVPFALPIESWPMINTSTEAVWNFFSEIALRIKKEDEAQCEVTETSWKTFDGIEFNCLHPHDHELVVAEDCHIAPKFVVLTKKEFANSTREISLFLGKRRIAIYPSSSSSLNVTLDGSPLLLNEAVYEEKEDYINIYQQNGSIIILASEFGLEELVYDGKILKVTISSWMRGKTCGICGKANWETHDEMEMPNHKQARDCTAFFHAWLLVKENCDKGCKIQRKYEFLDLVVKGEESTCFSTEPVLKCRKGCRSAETTRLDVGFHCFPRDLSMSLTQWVNTRNKQAFTEDKVEAIDADINCTCMRDHPPL